MTPTQVLQSLQCVGATSGLDLVQVISACGAFVSGPTRRRVVDKLEDCWNLGGHSFCTAGGVTCWPDPSPLSADLLSEVFEFIAWSQGSEHVRCCVCDKEVATTMRQLHPCINPGAVRNQLMICKPCEHRLQWSRRDLRVVVVGDVSPNPGALAFLGPAGDRLRSMIGLDVEAFYRHVLPINVRPSPGALRPHRVPHEVFSRLHGMSIEPVILDGRLPIVLLGRAALLGFHGQQLEPKPPTRPEFELGRVGQQRVFYFPHPSGRCRHWNVPENRDQLYHLFQGLIAGG